MLDDAEDRPDPLEGRSAWDDDVLADPFSSSVFSQEIAGIDESDWAIDSALIWGDDTADADGPETGLASGPNFIA